MRAAIPYIIIAVLVTVLVMTLFRKSVPNEKLIRAEMEIEFKDREIKAITAQRERDRGMYDSVLTTLRQRDGEKVEQIKQIVYKYEKIPIYINSLNRDSLRAAVRHSVLSD